MPSRKYYLVGDGTAINMRQKLAREKAIRSVSISSCGDNVSSMKSNYICEVTKSPRAPEYVVHFVKTKADGIQMIRHRPRPVRRLLEQETGSNRTQPSEDEGNLESETTDQEKDNMVGLRVIACNKQDGLYYPGHVSHTPESAYAIVKFSYQKCQKVRTQMIIPMSGAVPRPELAPGDFVLVQVFNQSKKTECFVPGIVEVIPEDSRHHAKFYSVLLFNGQRETTLRKFIVKIGKARFEMAIRYIAHIQQQRLLRQEGTLSDNSELTSPQSTKRSDDDVSSTKSSQSGRGRRKKEKITKKIGKSKEKEKNSRSSRRKSRSRSRSKSSRSSRSSSRSPAPKSRSRSSSSSSSTTIRSRSSVQMSRSKSAAGRRSRSSSKSSRSRSRSRSKESKGSSTPRAQSPYERPHRPTPTARPRTPPIRTESMLEAADVTRRDIYNERSYLTTTSKYGNVDEKDEIVQALQYQLEKQKRKQLRQEMRLVRQARKINKIQSKLHASDISHNESGHSSRTDRSDKFKSPRSSSSETDTSPQKRKGSPDGTSYRESPYLQSARKSSSELKTNQEVLARWQDDGWYYNGCVVAEKSDQKYIVRDSTGYTEIIARDDILTENEHRFDAIQPEDHVIGLHPKYAHSFAPAEVLGTYSNSSVKVEFFDGNIAELTQKDVFRISKEKYDQVVGYIKRCEKHLIGHSVVARDDTTGQYKLGIVDSRVGLGQQYYIKWLDGDMTKQNANHIFDVARRQAYHEDWSHVLAPTGQQSMNFMPAEVIQFNPLVVKFCDGKRSSDTTLDQCFWLSKGYYDNAREYFVNVKYRRYGNNIA